MAGVVRGFHGNQCTEDILKCESAVARTNQKSQARNAERGHTSVSGEVIEASHEPALRLALDRLSHPLPLNGGPMLRDEAHQRRASATHSTGAVTDGSARQMPCSQRQA